MRYNGFSERYTDGQYVIDFEMPRVLENVFSVTLYGRGKLLDVTDGAPEVIWQRLSHNFDNIHLVAPKQVHGTRIIDAAKSIALPERPEADGVFIGSGAETFASLRFADCVPVVISGAEPVPWMYILHSGFVGTLHNIEAAAQIDFERRFGRGLPKASWAWLGPGICAKCYCRSSEGDLRTEEAMSEFSPENIRRAGEKTFFDIQGQIRRQLLTVGVESENIFTFSDCTAENRETLYSCRGGDAENRLFLLAGMRQKQ